VIIDALFGNKVENGEPIRKRAKMAPDLLKVRIGKQYASSRTRFFHGKSCASAFRWCDLRDVFVSLGSLREIDIYLLFKLLYG
jgi:hypothetical protein